MFADSGQALQAARQNFLEIPNPRITTTSARIEVTDVRSQTVTGKMLDEQDNPVLECGCPICACARKADLKNPIASANKTNFGIGWETTPNFPPQLVDSQTLGFVPSSGNTLPSAIGGADSLPARPEGYELVRVVIFGSNYGVNYVIRWLWGLSFAQISEWSFPIPAPGSSELMSIATKRIPRLSK